ncbi:glycerate kinase [Enterococcus quebecensis]|uniref:Glycerate kinase n=1 Tax=Enterococcus quebecensis TaxID=903983 RepID=A0A1E5GRW9_9ENTE|nr:glycerate kinase [Enterococcus quebecensis]OEG15463.1 glycerate kinase [Enterococcus quebecensis]OJG74039.1 glycerate kinase [Enterococcus quebecensis]
MNIVTAIDSMKGSLTSVEANQIIAKIFAEKGHSVTAIAIADGGEGTVEAVMKNKGGQKITQQVQALNGQLVTVDYGWFKSEKLAVIESAAASGIQYLDAIKQTHPLNTSSYGTGELIQAAVEKGAKRIVVGLGGTGTIDGGIGVLNALGVEFFDQEDQLLPAKGSSLAKVARISVKKLDERLADVAFYIASDVDSPLLGETGAVYMFGQQKGLEKNELARYEEGMRNYQKIASGDDKPSKGDGAAGGMGFAIRFFLKGMVQSGFEFISEQTDLEALIRQADLVITGEGQMDNQSLQGKVPVGIGRIAKKYNVPVVAFVGSFKGNSILFHEEGVSVIIPIVDRITSLDEALKEANINLEKAVDRSLNLLTLMKRYGK